jgi:hypothetical protein
MTTAALLITGMFAAVFMYQRQRARSRASLLAARTAPKSYLQMTDAEKLAFIEAQERRILNMMGDRPVKLSDEALQVIKVRVDHYAARQNSASLKPGEENLRDVYGGRPNIFRYRPGLRSAEDSDRRRRVSADDRICLQPVLRK